MSEELTPWEKYKQNLGETRPWDIVNPKTEWADEDKINKRYSICKACPELIKLTSQCRECKCIMKIKTKLAEASCPIGKW